MYRIYLDTNVFNILKRPDGDQYNHLRNAMERYSQNLHYIYSHAHLLDLQRDKTDNKFDDLKYLESWVGNSYIVQYYREKRANCHLMTPGKAFEEMEPADRLEGNIKIDDIFTGSTEMEAAGQILKTVLADQRVDISSDIIAKQPEYIQSFYKKFFNLERPDVSMLDAVNGFSDMYKSIATNDKSFRELRQIIIQAVNPAMEKLQYDKDFNDALKDTHIKKTFRDFVLGSLHKKDPTVQDVFLQAYMCLHILGIDQEKNKKARFLNTTADSFHSYYGAHCDYVVSTDESFLRKTYTVYKLFDIETKVYSLADFSKEIDSIGICPGISSSAFFSSLAFDLKNGLVISQSDPVNSDFHRIIVRLAAPYFHFFTHIEQFFIPGKGTYISLYKSLESNYSRFLFFKEIAAVVDKVVAVMGNDDYFKANFSADEVQDILTGKWRGRVWSSSVCLGFVQSGRLALQFGPFDVAP